jgi:hypothetical protein
MANGAQDAANKTGMTEDQLAELAKHIKKFEDSMPAAAKQAYNEALKNATEGNIDKLFTDPAKRQELEDFLKNKAGVQPTDDQPGSITSVVVTVAVHC